MFSISILDTEKRKQEEDGLYGTCQRCCDAIDTARRLIADNKTVEVKSGDALVFMISLKDGEKVEVDNRNEIVGCA